MDPLPDRGERSLTLTIQRVRTRTCAGVPFPLPGTETPVAVPGVRVRMRIRICSKAAVAVSRVRTHEMMWRCVEVCCVVRRNGSAEESFALNEVPILIDYPFADRLRTVDDDDDDDQKNKK